MRLSIVASAIVALSACQDKAADYGLEHWVFHVDTIRSEMDGTVKYGTTLEIVGKEGPEGSPRILPVRLHLYCQHEGVGAALLSAKSLGRGLVQIRLRMDSLPAYYAQGYVGTYASGGLVTIAELDPLLDSLRGHRRALIEYPDAEGVSHTVAEFAVDGFDALRSQFLTACVGR
jgi:hypothetical protein